MADECVQDICTFVICIYIYRGKENGYYCLGFRDLQGSGIRD